MTSASENILHNLQTNLPHHLRGDFELLAGTPGTEEFGQFNVRPTDKPTGQDVQQAIMNALAESGVGIDRIVSSAIDATRCTLGLMMGDAEGTAIVNIGYHTDAPLRITVLRTIPRTT